MAMHLDTSKMGLEIWYQHSANPWEIIPLNITKLIFNIYLFSSFALSCSSCLKTWTIIDSKTPLVKPAKLRGVERRLVEVHAAPFSSSNP